MRKNLSIIGNRHLWVIVPVLAFVAGCQNVPVTQKKPELKDLPPIISLLVKDGKGVPNGRSDGPDPYLHAPLDTASSAEYGFSADDPIRLGPWIRSIPTHIMYLNALRGPEGQAVAYERLGACCSPKHGERDGPLDIYRIKVDGNAREIYIFVDNYSKGLVQLPVGFQQRK